MHAENGTRLGCGLLELVSGNFTYAAETDSLTNASVKGDVTVYPVDDIACYFGMAKKLEPDLTSFLDAGQDCNFTNGCGVHIHAGFSCLNSTTQEGHLYNESLFAEDPWKYTSYLSTDAQGLAYFTGCVATGETQFDGRAFIVHANNGSRVSCGLLSLADSITAPAQSPASAPSASKSTALCVSTTKAAFATLAAFLAVAAW